MRGRSSPHPQTRHQHADLMPPFPKPQAQLQGRGATRGEVSRFTYSRTGGKLFPSELAQFVALVFFYSPRPPETKPGCSLVGPGDVHDPPTFCFCFYRVAGCLQEVNPRALKNRYVRSTPYINCDSDMYPFSSKCPKKIFLWWSFDDLVPFFLQ